MEREGFVTYYPAFKELYPWGWGSWGWPSVSVSVLAWVTVLRKLGAEVGRPQHWGLPQRADYEMEIDVQGVVGKLLGSKPWRERAESGLGGG